MSFDVSALDNAINDVLKADNEQEQTDGDGQEGSNGQEQELFSEESLTLTNPTTKIVNQDHLEYGTTPEYKGPASVISLDGNDDDLSILSSAYGSANNPQSSGNVLDDDDFMMPKRSMTEITGEYLEVAVTDPQKVGNVFSSHISYLVKTETSLAFFKRKELEVRRRYSDFLWLQTALKDNYLGVLIPPLPGKHNPLREDGFASDFVERRRRALEVFLRRVVQHPDLYKAYQVKIFLEGSDDDLANIRKNSDNADHKKALRAANAPMSSYKQFKVESPVVDAGVNDRINAATVYMNGLLGKLNAVDEGIEQIVLARMVVAEQLKEFASSMNSLGVFDDVHKATFEQMAASSNSVAQLTSMQGENESFLFGDTIKDWIKVTEQAQELLGSHEEAQKRYFYAQKNVEKAMGGTAQEMEVASKKMQIEENDMKRVKKGLTNELDRFHEEKAVAFENAVFNLVNAEIEHHQKVISSWQSVLSTLEENRHQKTELETSTSKSTKKSSQSKTKLDSMTEIEM